MNPDIITELSAASIHAISHLWWILQAISLLIFLSGLFAVGMGCFKKWGGSPGCRLTLVCAGMFCVGVAVVSSMRFDQACRAGATEVDLWARSVVIAIQNPDIVPIPRLSASGKLVALSLQIPGQEKRVAVDVLGANVVGNVPVEPAFEVIVSPDDIAILDKAGYLLACNVRDAIRGFASR